MFYKKYGLLLILVSFDIFASPYVKKEGGICHNEHFNYYYPGILQNINGHLVCNFWRFIDLSLLDEEERYDIEQYIENINNGIFIRDEEYDINILDEQEYQLNIKNGED